MSKGRIAQRLEALARFQPMEPDIKRIGQEMRAKIIAGARVWIFGNGGSAAMASHFAAEIVGRYRRPERKPFSAVAFTDAAVNTALGNDFDYGDLFFRQVRAHCRSGDIVVGISSSGRSANVRRGLVVAPYAGIQTLFITSASGPALRGTWTIAVPAGDTPIVQELQLTAIHLLCEEIDAP